MVFYKGFTMVRGDVLFMTRFEYGYGKLNSLRRKCEDLLYSTRYRNSDEEDEEMFREMIADIRDLFVELDNVQMTITSFSLSESNYEDWLERQKKEMEAALVASHVLKDKNYRPAKQRDTKELLEINPGLFFYEEDGQTEDEFWV